MAFIQANTRLLPVPHAPELALYVADEAVALWERTEAELDTIGLPPPFWAFAWAGGQALARYVLDHPELVRGKTVLDVASGSGLVGIAAARAGARQVLCCDLDPFAGAAMALNAAVNEVVVEPLIADLTGRDEGWDVVLAGDVFYERDMAAAMAAWFERLAGRGAPVLVGDPGRAYLPRAWLEELAAYQVPVTRAVEDADVKRSAVYRLHA